MPNHPAFTTPPPPTSFVKLTFPAPRIALVTMSRPQKLNCTSAADVVEITKVYTWIDAEPNISVSILTGSGRAFSTGADLAEWRAKVAAASEAGSSVGAGPGDVLGAVPMSNRRGKKPVIAAVNGLALGGGCETVINSDIVLASEDATFGLVEVKRGLAAYAGALPRLIRTVGLQRASEFALMGRIIGAREAMDWGFVNKVVEKGKVVEEAVEWAKVIAESSPDAVITTRAGLREGWEVASVVEAQRRTSEKEWAELQKGENMKEGLDAFRTRRTPVWKGAKL